MYEACVCGLELLVYKLLVYQALSAKVLVTDVSKDTLAHTSVCARELETSRACAASLYEAYKCMRPYLRPLLVYAALYEAY
jgi:hypothetical protein